MEKKQAARKQQTHKEERRKPDDKLRTTCKELKAACSRFADLYDHAPVGYITTDRNGMIVECNNAAADLLQDNKGRLTHRHFDSFISKDDINIYNLHIKKVLVRKKIQHCKLRLTRIRGNPLIVLIQSAADRSSVSKHPLIRSTITDITDIHMSDIAIRESAQKYRALFEKSAEAVYIIDSKTNRILECNHKASAITGYRTRELIAMTVEELYPSEEQNIVQKIFNKIAEGGSLSGISGINHLRKDRRLVPVEINAATFAIDDKKYILSIVKDITGQKKEEEEKAQLLEKLDQVRKEINTLAYIVSHDLKAPLRSISSITESIAADYSGTFDDRGKEYIRLLVNGVRHMSSTIDNIHSD